MAAMIISLGIFPVTGFAIDCGRAKTAPEQAICSNPELKAFDTYLAKAYSDIRGIVPVDLFNDVKKSQIEWIKKRDVKCGGNVTCLMQETQQRTAVLSDFVQSYIERLRIELLGNQPVDDVQIVTDSPPDRPLDPKAIYQKAAQSVVVVVAFNDKSGDLSQGSGVVIAENKIATNCHILEKSNSTVVFFKGKPYQTESVVGNKALDYCILYTVDLPARIADLAELSTVTPGQRVYSVGSPRGLDLTIAEGLISGLRDQDDIAFPLIQTSAAISPGSSGGGLFDEYGRVIGITTFLLKDSQNINFALPVELSRIIIN
ncbi:trypsin-like peptidase domain-containing protein [Ostreibacterium oceani]|nr:trypsin-like peptidase domain-containing protein [Ostreibacterium oceani]